MPLSNDGKKVLRAMKEQYGERGERIFYAKENKDEKFRNLVRKGADPDEDPVTWWLLRLLSMPTKDRLTN